jgi:excinuclease ABC subunit C
VKGLFTRPAFTGFGPSELVPTRALPLIVLRAARSSRLREGVRAECPRLPGVYGMVDRQGELIYVGKAKCLRSRLLSYFRPRSREAKAGHIIHETRRLVWEVAHDEWAALLRELELIRRWQPRWNVQGQPRRYRRQYVCVGRQPAPYVFLAGQPPATAFARFGPIPAGRKAREAVRRVNDWFRLRDCPQSQEMIFADQRELFPLPLTPGCLRHEINRCLGPCAAVCSQDSYQAAVRDALAFLNGSDPAPLEALEHDMTAASAALQFERAAVLRDKLDLLRWLHDQLERLRQAVRHSFVYRVTGHDDSEVWYLIHQGRTRAAVATPRTDAARQETAVRLAAVFRDTTAPCPPTPDVVGGVLLVASWFRRHPAERQHTLTPDEAQRMCSTGVAPSSPCG